MKTASVKKLPNAEGRRKVSMGVGSYTLLSYCLPQPFRLVTSPLSFRGAGLTREAGIQVCPSPTPQAQPQVHTFSRLHHYHSNSNQRSQHWKPVDACPPGTPPPRQNLIFITAITLVLHNGTYINT